MKDHFAWVVHKVGTLYLHPDGDNYSPYITKHRLPFPHYLGLQAVSYCVVVTRNLTLNITPRKIVLSLVLITTDSEEYQAIKKVENIVRCQPLHNLKTYSVWAAE